MGEGCEGWGTMGVTGEKIVATPRWVLGQELQHINR